MVAVRQSHGKSSHTARYPACSNAHTHRAPHIISEHRIPNGTVSQTARYRKRDGIRRHGTGVHRIDCDDIGVLPRADGNDAVNRRQDLGYGTGYRHVPT
jgi:hypothetical protein